MSVTGTGSHAEDAEFRRVGDRCVQARAQAQRQHAAGIAYRVLFSLVPLSIILVAIFGLVLRNDDLRDDVIREIIDALPLTESGGADVTREIENLASPATALGLVSLLVFGWAATGMMASLRAGLEVAMRVERGRPAELTVIAFDRPINARVGGGRR